MLLSISVYYHCIVHSQSKGIMENSTRVKYAKLLSEPNINVVVSTNSLDPESHLFNTVSKEILCGHESMKVTDNLEGKAIILDDFIAQYLSGTYCAPCGRYALQMFDDWVSDSLANI